MQKALILAAITLGCLTALPAQAFFCSKSNKQPRPQYSPVFYYPQQQQYLMPYTFQTMYTPNYQYSYNPYIYMR